MYKDVRAPALLSTYRTSSDCGSMWIPLLSSHRYGIIQKHLSTSFESSLPTQTGVLGETYFLCSFWIKLPFVNNPRWKFRLPARSKCQYAKLFKRRRQDPQLHSHDV